VFTSKFSAETVHRRVFAINMVENSVELLVRFCHTAVTAPYMYNCHILEHEDNGRMGQFIVR